MAEAFARDRPRPAGLLPRLHDQGLGHADRRPQGQSRRADEQDPDGRMAGATWACPRAQEWEKFATVKDPDALQAFLADGRSSPRARGAIPTADSRARRSRSPADREISTQMAFGKILDDIVQDRQRAGRAHRHHLARRDRHDQSRPLGEPAQAVCPQGAGRHLHDRATIPSTAKWEFDAGGPAYRAGHRRDEPVPAARRGRPVAFAVRQAADPDRHASTIPSSPAASMR